MYGLPGGWLEKYEDWHDCASRELKEETGLVFNKNRFSCLASLNCHRQYENYHAISLIMYTEIDNQNEKKLVKNLEPNKCEKWIWITIDKLRQNISKLFYPLQDFLNMHTNLDSVEKLRNLVNFDSKSCIENPKQKPYKNNIVNNDNNYSNNYDKFDEEECFKLSSNKETRYNSTDHDTFDENINEISCSDKRQYYTSNSLTSKVLLCQSKNSQYDTNVISNNKFIENNYESVLKNRIIDQDDINIEYKDCIKLNKEPVLSLDNSYKNNIVKRNVLTKNNTNLIKSKLSNKQCNKKLSKKNKRKKKKEIQRCKDLKNKNNKIIDDAYNESLSLSKQNTKEESDLINNNLCKINSNSVDKEYKSSNKNVNKQIMSDIEKTLISYEMIIKENNLDIGIYIYKNKDYLSMSNCYDESSFKMENSSKLTKDDLCLNYEI